MKKKFQQDFRSIYGEKQIQIFLNSDSNYIINNNYSAQTQRRLKELDKNKDYFKIKFKSPTKKQQRNKQNFSLQTASHLSHITQYNGLKDWHLQSHLKKTNCKKQLIKLGFITRKGSLIDKKQELHQKIETLTSGRISPCSKKKQNSDICEKYFFENKNKTIKESTYAQSQSDLTKLQKKQSFVKLPVNLQLDDNHKQIYAKLKKQKQYLELKETQLEFKKLKRLQKIIQLGKIRMGQIKNVYKVPNGENNYKNLNMILERGIVTPSLRLYPQKFDINFNKNQNIRVENSITKEDFNKCLEKFKGKYQFSQRNYQNLK